MSEVQKIKNGTRRSENGWIRITTHGSPYDRGYANGYLLAPEIKEGFHMLDFNFMDTYGLSREFFADVIPALFGDTIRNNYNEFYEEMRGITAGAAANGASVTLNDIMTWNCYYSIDYMMSHLPGLIKENAELNKKYGHIFSSTSDAGATIGSAEGGAKDRCTGFIAVGNYTKDGKIVCGHNTFDNFIDSQFCNVMLEIKPDKGHSIIMQTSPGCIASGTDYYVTSNGLICTETTIGGFNKFVLRDPICCRIRKAMQYGDTLDDCLDMLTTGNGGDYANSWLLGDTRNNTIMRIELGLNYVKVERKKNGYFIGFNAPIDARIRNLECSNTGYDDIRRHQGARRVRLTQFMEEYKGKIDIEVGERILGDHYDVYLNKINPCSRTCCSHYDLDDRAFMSDPSRPKPYQPRGALDGIVTDSTLAKKMGLAARWGSSCGMPFDAKIFCERNIQWAVQEPYLKDRPEQPWTVFISDKQGKKKRHSRGRNKKKGKKLTRRR